jgi:hypothetical protein
MPNICTVLLYADSQYPHMPTISNTLLLVPLRLPLSSVPCVSNVGLLPMCRAFDVNAFHAAVATSDHTMAVTRCSRQPLGPSSALPSAAVAAAV